MRHRPRHGGAARARAARSRAGRRCVGRHGATGSRPTRRSRGGVAAGRSRPRSGRDHRRDRVDGGAALGHRSRPPLGQAGPRASPGRTARSPVRRTGQHRPCPRPHRDGCRRRRSRAGRLVAVGLRRATSRVAVDERPATAPREKQRPATAPREKQRSCRRRHNCSCRPNGTVTAVVRRRLVPTGPTRDRRWRPVATSDVATTSLHQRLPNLREHPWLLVSTPSFRRPWRGASRRRLLARRWRGRLAVRGRRSSGQRDSYVHRRTALQEPGRGGPPARRAAARVRGPGRCRGASAAPRGHAGRVRGGARARRSAGRVRRAQARGPRA